MLECLAALLLLVFASASPSPTPPAEPSPTAALARTFVPPPILMYHRVDPVRPADHVGRELTVTPASFESQLEYLRAHGIAALSMAELEKRLQHGQPLDHAVVLTFDDGYADQYTYALPLLHRFRDSATFYIVTGELGQPRHLTWAETVAMAHDRMDIAAHGVRHDDLSVMSPAQQAFEIDGSVRALRARLGVPVESYAYPSGRFNRATAAIVRAAGVPMAVTTDYRYVFPPENRFEITRLRVRGEWSLRDFAAALRAAEEKVRIVVP